MQWGRQFYMCKVTFTCNDGASKNTWHFFALIWHSRVSSLTTEFNTWRLWTVKWIRKKVTSSTYKNLSLFCSQFHKKAKVAYIRFSRGYTFSFQFTWSCLIIHYQFTVTLIKTLFGFGTFVANFTSFLGQSPNAHAVVVSFHCRSVSPTNLLPTLPVNTTRNCDKM